MKLKDNRINTRNNESFKNIAVITHLLSNVAQSLCWQFHLHEAMSLCQREGWAFEVEIVDEYCADDQWRKIGNSNKWKHFHGQMYNLSGTSPFEANALTWYLCLQTGQACWQPDVED